MLNERILDGPCSGQRLVWPSWKIAPLPNEVWVCQPSVRLVPGPYYRYVRGIDGYHWDAIARGRVT